ncbi:hypothetical protein XENTR_v10022467 [Xenopus tropicalis]|uniref:Nestin n=1 Tax=Xenopus tropicalis TaxID=8364 RepID=A0A803JEA0_XENTR|nr:nestin [Xenopus tropicalis]KAE8588333.1 hypothetical protein XENTR_v10022467 [Xenopus tropicalis]
MEGYLASVSLGEESTQMWSLNKRLEAYLSRVKALEEENEVLRAEIHTLKSSKSERCWKRKHHEEMMKLRDALDDGHNAMVQAEMVRESIYEEIEFIKQRCLEEKQAREDAKKELSESKRLLEEETRAQTWLKERLGQLEAELEDILRDHEEEKALMEEEIASFSQRLENFRVAPVAFKPVEVEDYARKLSEIWQGAVEDYKSEVSALEAGLSESKENLRKVLEENKQNRLLLQSLDKELVSLKMRKEALEDLLSKQWQEQKEEEEKLQLEAEALEQEKQDLRAQIAEVLEDRQQLMHLKMSLSLEVATYRSLLEAENTRIDTDYRASSTFNDSMLEHNNVRRRQSEDTRKHVSREHRQSYSKKQIGDKNGLSRPSLNNFSTVKSSTVPVRTSPVTKEFQKVSSVLQSQGLKYTKAPQVKEVQNVPTLKSNLETRTHSAEAVRRAKTETRSYSYSVQKSTDEQTVKKDTMGLNNLKNTGIKEEKVVKKPDVVDHVEIISGTSTQQKVPGIDPLESALKSLEEDLSRVPTNIDEGQSPNVEEIKDVQEEPISLENLQSKTASEFELLDINAEADVIEEVISESVSYQKVHFEKQELSNLLAMKNIFEEHVSPVFDSREQDASDQAITPQNELDVQQDIRTLVSYEIKESEIFSDNIEEAEIISQSINGYLHNEYIPVSKTERTDFTSQNNFESSQSFDDKHFEEKSTEDQLITSLDINTEVKESEIFSDNIEEAEIISKSVHGFLENEYIPVSKEDHTEFTSQQENDFESLQSFDSKRFEEKSTEDQPIINLDSNNEENNFPCNQEPEQDMYLEESHHHQEEYDYSDKNPVQKIDEKLSDIDQLVLEEQDNYENPKTSELIEVEHGSTELGQAEQDKSSEIPEEISENVSVEEIVHQISDVEEDTQQAFEDEGVIVQIIQKELESTELSSADLDGPGYAQEEDRQLAKDEVSISEVIEKDLEANEQERQKADHQVVDVMQEVKQSFEKEVDQLSNIKQEVDYLHNEEEDSLQNNYEEPQKLESSDLEEDNKNLTNMKEENQLSKDEGNQNSVDDIEEFSQQDYDVEEMCQETVDHQVSAQLLHESESSYDKSSMEDKEEQSNSETEDNIGLEQECDLENVKQTRSDEDAEFSQAECELVCKVETIPDSSEYIREQEDTDKQETDYSSNENVNYDLLEKEEVILPQMDDQNPVNEDGVTTDEELGGKITEKELSLVDVNESLAANKEQDDHFTNENAVEDNICMQENDIYQYQSKEDLFVDGTSMKENVEIQQTLFLNQEMIVGVDDVDKDISGEALSENESIEMDDVIDLTPKTKVNEDELISQMQDGKINLETTETTENNDAQLCFENENETKYIKVTDSPQFATELSQDAGGELNIDQSSENQQLSENPSETLSAPYFEYETVADPENQVSTEEQVQETENTLIKPADSKMENENSESEESVDSQEISLYSHKSEEFEISKDYQLEQTLPDSTPLPNLEDEFEDLTEARVKSPLEQPDSNPDEEHQNNDESGASTFTTSFNEAMQRDIIESASKDEEFDEEEFGRILGIDKTSPVEAITISGLAQEPCYLEDNEESEDSITRAEILKESPRNDLADFMVSQMSETKIIISEQVTEQTQGSLEFGDATNTFSGNINVSEKETYEYESNEENIEFTDDPDKDLLEGENQSVSPANNLVDENQSEDSIISDNEGTTSSYEDSPNATAINQVALEEHSMSTSEQSSTVIQLTASEGYEMTSSENVEDIAQETGKEFPSGLPASSTSEQEDSRSEDEELEDEGSEFSFGVNDEKVNGVHKDVSEHDGTEDMLNGHSEIVFTNKKSFEMENDVLDTQEIPEDSIITFAMSEAKSEGLFQSLLETSEPKDGSRIEEVFLSAESKKVTVGPEYLESSEEDRFTMLVQNPYLNDKANKEEPKTVAESFLVDEELLVSANQQINNEKYEGVLVTKTVNDEEDAWSSDD